MTTTADTPGVVFTASLRYFPFTRWVASPGAETESQDTYNKFVKHARRLTAAATIGASLAGAAVVMGFGIAIIRFPDTASQWVAAATVGILGAVLPTLFALLLMEDRHVARAAKLVEKHPHLFRNASQLRLYERSPDVDARTLFTVTGMINDLAKDRSALLQERLSMPDKNMTDPGRARREALDHDHAHRNKIIVSMLNRDVAPSGKPSLAAQALQDLTDVLDSQANGPDA